MNSKLSQPTTTKEFHCKCYSRNLEKQPVPENPILKPAAEMAGVNNDEASSAKGGKGPSRSDLAIDVKREGQVLPRTPENKYPRPYDWLYATASSGSESYSSCSLPEGTGSCNARILRECQKRKRPDYLRLSENGRYVYQKFYPIPFDIYKGRENASTPSIIDSDSGADSGMDSAAAVKGDSAEDSDSDDGIFMYDSSYSDGESADSTSEESSPSHEVWSNSHTSPEQENGGAVKSHDKPVGATKVPSGWIGRTSTSEVVGFAMRESPEGLQESSPKPEKLKGKNKPFQAGSGKVLDFEWGFELGKGTRDSDAEGKRQGMMIEGKMDAAKLEAIGKAFSKARKTPGAKQSRFPGAERGESSSRAGTQVTAGPKQIIGKEGRPSRLMPPSTIAHFRKVEERLRLAAQAQMAIDRGILVRARQGATPALEHPTPHRTLTVVTDFEASLRGESS